MQSLTSAVLAVALVAAQFPPVRPKVPPPPEEPPPADLSPTAQAANKKVLAQMQGAWRLVEMQLVDDSTPSAQHNLPKPSFDHFGYCVVGGNYLSVEIHVGLRNGESETVGRSFISGIHRFEFDIESRIGTTTMIGANIDANGMTVFEQPGTRRHYRVEATTKSMTLTRDDGHTLVFERMLDDRTRFDPYGRPLREKPDAGKDAAGEAGKKGAKPDDKKPGDSGKEGGG